MLLTKLTVFRKKPEKCRNGYRQTDENEDEGIEKHIQAGAGMRWFEQLGIIKYLDDPRNRPLVQLSQGCYWYKLTEFSEFYFPEYHDRSKPLDCNGWLSQMAIVQ